MKTPDELISIPPRDQMGPAMRQLNERQQRFVCALAVFGGEQKAAYLWAGYDATNDGSAIASSSRLANSEKVIAAVQEEALRRINSATLLAVSTLVEQASPLSGCDDKTRQKAAVAILDRVHGFSSKSEQRIVIRDERTTKELVDFIRANAHLAGATPEALLGAPKKIIDAEFTEVTGIEDML